MTSQRDRDHCFCNEQPDKGDKQHRHWVRHQELQVSTSTYACTRRADMCSLFAAAVPRENPGRAPAYRDVNVHVNNWLNCELEAAGVIKRVRT